MGCWDACPPKHQEGCPEECHAMADTASKIVENCHHNSDNPAIDCDQLKMVPEIAKETGKSQDDVHKCWAACAPKHQAPLNVGDEVVLDGDHACVKEVVPHDKVVLDYKDGQTSHEVIKWKDEGFSKIKIATEKKKNCQAPLKVELKVGDEVVLDGD